MLALIGLVTFILGLSTMKKNPIAGIVICGIGSGILTAIASL